ncbi:hypothetical protein B0A48_13165 [Cryoendolithus antarcticus]|uniref:Heterokaryon incompatibility domain-containing protein n=1 Tax=Cryoendolithus antarcticus TaxID=1507870 RepID=A0A1V8SND5_9PEZI|nr:hypothetical protein B0A48_13165 [Cryoendolithus antarcticus]
MSDRIDYSPLNYNDEEIRLLQIDLSGSGRHELKSGVSLRIGRPEYTALSYTWGDPGDKSQMSIDSTMISVSRHLVIALQDVIAFWKRVFPTRTELLLWVDQVCINQAHDAEKNHQVQFMGVIYRRAEQVVVSLPVSRGVKNNFYDWTAWSDWHLRSCEKLSIPSDPPQYERIQQMRYRASPAAEAGLMQRDHDSLVAWNNVNAIVQSPWWGRAWVYQEVVLASRATFLFDGLSVSLDQLQRFLATCRSYQEVYKSSHQPRDATSAKHPGLVESGCVACNGYARRLTRCGIDGVACWASFYYHGLTPCPHFLGPGGTGDDLVIGTQIGCMYCALAAWIAGTVLLLSFTVGAGLAALFTGVDLETILTKRRAKSGNKTHIVTQIQTYLNDGTTWNLSSFMFRDHAARKGNESFTPLSALMTHARNCQSTDPRDKVYAFLGLALPAYNITVDYDAANTIGTVLTETAIAIIREEKRLDILAIAMDDKGVSSMNDMLPSWVPNWYKPSNPQSEYKRYLRGIGFPGAEGDMADGVRARASTTRSPHVSFRADRAGRRNRILVVQAIRVDILAVIVEDTNYQPSRRFTGRAGLGVGTTSKARVGDEVWVLLGADEPYCLTKPDDLDGLRTILGHAMLWENGVHSRIMYGSLVEALDRGEVAAEMISIA